MSFKKLLVILTFVCLQTKLNALRPLDSLKKPISPLKSIQVVHYVVRNPDKTLRIESVGVKNLKINYNREWLAKSTWDDSYNKTGWSVLEIETNENATDVDQAYAAGLLEGSLTKELISLHLLNNVGDFCQDSSDICQKLIAFLTENFQWMNDQIKSNIDDPYWNQINLALTQLGGLFNGYNQTFDSSVDIETFPKLIQNHVDSFLSLVLLNLGGDLGEILAAITKTSNPFYAGSCSALIKVLDNNSDLFVSHDTWDEFESMLRIMKFYKFYYHYNYQDPVNVPGTQMTFSSYPGIIVSVDDFYQTNANLAIIETTIGNSNADLWKFVTPQLNLYWVRVLAANRLSSNGVEWAKWFSLFNSGTYNNQWMIVDYNKFTPNQPLRDGLFIVLEQIPGYIVWEDKTDVLRTQSYWPSYNLPYYPFIYNISGVYDAYLKYGDFFSYSNSPRANIFRRDHSKVTDIDSMIKMMRYNDYSNDPFSRCDKCSPPYSAENTIAARSDLNPINGTYPFEALGHRDHGATDMKLTSWSMNQKLEFIGISGPTNGFPNVPPFVWSLSDFNNNTNHFGQPDNWDFDPLHIQWSL